MQAPHARTCSLYLAQATGLTLARAIKRLRVEAARRLLSESHAQVNLGGARQEAIEAQSVHFL